MTSRFRVARLSLLAFGMLYPYSLFAQSQQASPPARSNATTPVLNEQQRLGKGLFMQNCSLCHLPDRDNPKNPVDDGSTVGPLLKGLFRGEKPRREDVVREFIQKGTPRMPGFRYGLEPKEIDNIIAYLKTL